MWSGASRPGAGPAIMDQHLHCLNCVSRRCMVRLEENVSCDLIGCPLVCGAVFHSCKASEHRLLCPLERVPCLNSEFGCPFVIARNKIGEHLEFCPASVVCCTMEWNRWPVSYADRKSYESLSKDCDGVEQLDMALALQDQRMLLESLKVVTTASNTAAKQFRNTEPIPVALGVSDEAPSSSLLSANEEAYSELYRATVETTRTLAVALDLLNNATKEPEPVNGRLPKERTERDGGVQVAEEEPAKEPHYMENNNDLCKSGIEDGAEGSAEHDPMVEGQSWRDWNLCMEENGFHTLSGMVTGADDEVDGCIQVKTSSLCNGFHEADVDTSTLDREGIDSYDCDQQAEEVVNGSCHLNDIDDSGSSSEPDQFLPVFAQLLTVESLLNADHFQEGSLLSDACGVGKMASRCGERQALKNATTFKLLEGHNGRRAYLGDMNWYRRKMESKAVDTSDLEVDDDPLELQGIDLITAALLFCLGDSPSGRGISDSRSVDGSHVDLGTQTFSFPAAILATNTMVGEIASASACDHANPQLSNPSPFQTLGLDLVLECVTRHQTKQRSMFTFVCGQFFRRDEFPSHFKNVHGDIHAGLNGWLEHRCPLAYYGCTYSQRRFCPSTQGSRVIHDRHLKSFGIQPCVPSVLLDTHEGRTPCTGAAVDQLSRLPFEILQHIAGFLDGFSLSQLSEVSHLMRDVCGSLLQVRGMVLLLWEKRQNLHGQTSWKTKGKAWRFSTAFGTVSEWKFAEIASMADHLKDCRYNTVERTGEAVPLPCMCVTRELTKGGRPLRSVLKAVL
ncbi:F-box only protein 30a [Pristis pectinata]|uniref:F-box only protein 30a n=1 Tax=Pristis pectinata TaxID=685728 RepID=UPI00223D0643|nr:F-box only protein 30a [Pristis pectinata]